MADKNNISLVNRHLRMSFLAGTFATSVLWVSTDHFGLTSNDETYSELEDQRYSSTFDPPNKYDQNDSLITDISVPTLLGLAYMAIRVRQKNKNVAYHEAGHALSLIHNKPGAYLDKAWIKKNSFSGYGKTEFHPLSPRISQTDARKMISSMFSGNAAERIGCNDYVSHSDSKDNKMAHKTAKQIVEQQNSHRNETGTSVLSHIIKKSQDWLNNRRDIAQILAEQKEDAYSFLLEHEDELHVLAEALLDHESMSREEMFEVLNLTDTEVDTSHTLDKV